MSRAPVHAEPTTHRVAWLTALRRYLAFVIPANLVWEIAQLPLYTIWSTGSWGEIVFAVIHCTGGDALMASTSLLGALLFFGNERWPNDRYEAVAVCTLAVGIAVTIFIEWLSTEVRASWAYTESMPRLPVIGTGLSPLAQWIVIPLAGFWWARRTVAHVSSLVEERSS